jgi:chemotaxis protein MotA
MSRWQVHSNPRWMQRWASAGENELDRGIVYGTVLSVALIGFGILLSGKGLYFLDPAALAVVLGGTIGATMVQFSSADLSHALRACRKVMLSKQCCSLERISAFVEYAQAVKRNGILVLEQEAQRASDPFLRKALELSVDGQTESDMRRILETELRASQERSVRAVQVLETMGAYAPALGLIGTLIGLIQMLGALDNPAAIGPAMSQALVTTFYGAILSNLMFLPLAGKMRGRSDEESLVRAITIEGAISLSKQESSIVMEQRLQSFLPLCAPQETKTWQRKAV